jgi:hypothetical protein
MTQAIMANSLYEMMAWCTSVIARQEDGTVIFSRNLDFQHRDLMKKVAYNAQFVHGSKPAFTATMFAGDVGVWTGVKPNGFALSINQRSLWKAGGFLVNMKKLFGGVSEVSWLTRKTLDECDDFQCAHKRLAHDEIVSLAYVQLAGLKDNEGVVITRKRSGPVHEAWLSNTTWFLVQTNNDEWLKDGCWGRCLVAT